MASQFRWLTFALATAVCLSSAESAWAHAGHSGPQGNAWASGAMHPLAGLDHLLAMLASGLLAIRMGTRRALWVMPASFTVLMLSGGALAALGVPFAAAEWGIGLSVIVLGLGVAVLPRLPLGAGAALVGLFAICHGHAHVAEIGSQALLPYMAGFTATTLGLHVAAIGLGLVALRAGQPRLVRFAGAGIAAGFAVLLVAG